MITDQTGGVYKSLLIGFVSDILGSQEVVGFVEKINAVMRHACAPFLYRRECTHLSATDAWDRPSVDDGPMRRYLMGKSQPLSTTLH